MALAQAEANLEGEGFGEDAEFRSRLDSPTKEIRLAQVAMNGRWDDMTWDAAAAGGQVSSHSRKQSP